MTKRPPIHSWRHKVKAGLTGGGNSRVEKALPQCNRKTPLAWWWRHRKAFHALQINNSAESQFPQFFPPGLLYNMG